MTTMIITENVFQGTIYAQRNYFNPNCRISPENGTNAVSFFLPLTDCGNLIQEAGEDIFVSNTIILQKHRVVETESDIMQNVSCKLRHTESTYTQELSYESQPIRYRNKNVESWMEFQIEGNILGSDIPNTVLIGDEFLVVIHLKSGGIFRDLQVEKCWAYEGETISTSEYSMEIFNSHTCEQSEWILGFNLTKSTDNFSDLKAYGMIKAFKFPLSKNLHFTCSIQICMNSCLKYCDMPESERSNLHPRRYKRSSLDSDRTLRERHRLMKATIKALGAKLIEKNRGSLAENDSGFFRRASSHKNGTVGSIESYYSNGTVNILELEGPTSTTEDGRGTEMPWNDMYSFNLTNNIVVFANHESNFRHVYLSSPVLPQKCTAKQSYSLITAILIFLTLSLIFLCTGLLLYIRKERKRHIVDNVLLYNL